MIFGRKRKQTLLGTRGTTFDQFQFVSENDFGVWLADETALSEKFVYIPTIWNWFGLIWFMYVVQYEIRLWF